MRKLFVLFLLLCAPVLFAATTLEVRSAKYVMTVEADGEWKARTYNVRIADQETGAVLATQRLSESAAEARAKVELDDNSVLDISVHDTGLYVNATLLVQANGQTIDFLSGRWLMKNRTGILPEPAVALPDGPPYPLRVGGDVKAPVVIERVEPIYPADARAARIAGIVILEVIIDRNGYVKNPRVLKPLPFNLDQAAVDAVKQWRFRPGTLNGEPVDVIFNLTINFKLSEVEEP